ncbi:hypothetical protein SAMN04487995_2504 [Dyadobacter koreensis]|uniref:Por secretion system C-terminal sorting domain-containing protein n=1 Tax=Dyadobacter koreensis TaxID=408657 RepID=A0A1H6TZR2_9BACT|nr:hypothetical protein [Dyadobacter koreensis]SEI85533.1 hypothetical protein SAMN04487995_2504 [Dyadobacter koreensis]
MKNSIKTIIFALAIITTASFAANAEDKENKKASSFGTGIYASRNGKINVLVDKQNANTATTLLVRSSQGNIVYRETIEKGNTKFGRLLNVSDLEPGRYEIKIISNKETQTKSFELSAPTTERVLKIQ